MENSDLASLKLSRIQPGQIRIVRNILNKYGIKFEIKSNKENNLTLTLERDHFYSLFDFLMLMLTQFDSQQQEIMALKEAVKRPANPKWVSKIRNEDSATDFMLENINPYRDNLDAEDHIDYITDELVYRGVEYNIIGDNMEFTDESAETLLEVCWLIVSAYFDNDQNISEMRWQCNQS